MLDRHGGLHKYSRAFKDIVPSHSLAKFLSVLTFAQLLPMLLSALHRLNIPVLTPSQSAFEGMEEPLGAVVEYADAIVGLRIWEDRATCD